MAKSLDALISFLLDEIALCGEEGQYFRDVLFLFTIHARRASVPSKAMELPPNVCVFFLARLSENLMCTTAFERTFTGFYLIGHNICLTTNNVG